MGESVVMTRTWQGREKPNITVYFVVRKISEGSFL